MTAKLKFQELEHATEFQNFFVKKRVAKISTTAVFKHKKTRYLKEERFLLGVISLKRQLKNKLKIYL